MFIELKGERIFRILRRLQGEKLYSALSVGGVKWKYENQIELLPEGDRLP